MINKKIVILTALGLLATTASAQAQQAKNGTNIRDVTGSKLGTGGDQFYHAPHQFQILDDRPVVRDFREAPSAPGGFQLPPPPQGFAGGNGGGGAGYAPGPGAGGGDSPMQLQAPAGMPAYRGGPSGLSSLPKSGFNGPSNIPAGGIGPKNALPNGQTTGVHANLMPYAKPTSAAAGPARAAQAAPAYSAPAASYGGPSYNTARTAASGSGMQSSTSLSGTLLTKLKGNR